MSHHTAPHCNFVSTRARYLSVPKQADLVDLTELSESGELRPVIDRTHPLPESPVAFGYVKGGTRAEIALRLRMRVGRLVTLL